MVDAAPREVVYSPGCAFVDGTTVLTYLLLQEFPHREENFVDSIRWRSQSNIVLLGNTKKAGSIFVKRSFVEIEVEPDVFIYNNGVLCNRHQSPLSASLSVFAS